jgi:hypothetical protein
MALGDPGEVGGWSRQALDWLAASGIFGRAR